MHNIESYEVDCTMKIQRRIIVVLGLNNVNLPPIDGCLPIEVSPGLAPGPQLYSPEYTKQFRNELINQYDCLQIIYNMPICIAP